MNIILLIRTFPNFLMLAARLFLLLQGALVVSVMPRAVKSKEHYYEV